MSEPKFNIGDKVVVVDEQSTYGDYKNGDVGFVYGFDSELHGYVRRTDGLLMNVYWKEIKLFEESSIQPLEEVVKPTAWKIGDVEFILEPNNKVYIIGNGEINIDVDILKKILTTLDNR